VDYGQLVKTYAVTNLNKDAASRYSPAEVVSTERTVVTGMPDLPTFEPLKRQDGQGLRQEKDPRNEN
jgi:hypothetical protein